MNSLQSDHDRAKLAYIKEEVHSDQYEQGQTINLNLTNMKTKNTIQLFWAMSILTSFLLLTGCQYENAEFSKSSVSEEISKVSLQRLAEMNFDQSISSGLYDDIENRISSLSQEDYDQYFSFWVEIGLQKSIDKGFLSQDQKDIEIQKEYHQRDVYDKKSKEVYGVPMYKLSLDKQLDIVDMFSANFQSHNKVAASCPTYYYPTVISNDGTGTYSCVGIYSVGNPGTSDCDWEFAYNLGNNIVYGKAKTLSLRASAIFLKGGINYRRPNAPENIAHRRFLVGAGKIDIAYPGDGYSAAQLFADDVKFRGLV